MSKEIHHPSREQLDLSAVLEALSDPVRRMIVARLVEHDEQVCAAFCDLTSKTNLTYHVARLREAGVTRTRADGPRRWLSVRLEDLEARFPGLMQSILAATPVPVCSETMDAINKALGPERVAAET